MSYTVEREVNCEIEDFQWRQCNIEYVVLVLAANSV